MSDTFQVATDVFQGPLDLLLALIEKHKLHINDVSLSKVTDDYIEYIQTHSEFPTADGAQFIFIASTLLLIKSRSLLPVLVLTPDEESDIADLETRLRIHKRLKETEPHIQSKYGKNIAFFSHAPDTMTAVFAPSKDLTVQALVSSIASVLSALPKVEKIPRHIVEKVISLEETIERLTARITESISMSFSDFTKGSTEKVALIVGFLAVLELVKQGSIDVRQDAMFNDIQMETSAVGTPRYGSSYMV